MTTAPDAVPADLPPERAQQVEELDEPSTGVPAELPSSGAATASERASAQVAAELSDRPARD